MAWSSIVKHAKQYGMGESMLPSSCTLNLVRLLTNLDSSQSFESALSQAAPVDQQDLNNNNLQDLGITQFFRMLRNCE